jgi:GTP-binding protein HflX
MSLSELPQSSARTERALLVGVYPPHVPPERSDQQIGELTKLAETAGAEIECFTRQHIRDIHPATYVGRGKVDELRSLVGENDLDLVVFSRDLSPVQQRNLEDRLGIRVIDRTELILDIFAQHAQTRDGKIQVELAQLRYLRPRLTGGRRDLSRLGGGIGTRGPGETQLEVDRRRINKRIEHLAKDLRAIERTNRIQRRARHRRGVATAVLVGYTNAGKSTLLNRLTSANVVARDQLFSTLDTTTRKLYLGERKMLLLSDTVGFITDLPEPLLAAFRATLEVVEEADLILHVVDASSPHIDLEMEAVAGLMRELGGDKKPTVTVFNKWDCVKSKQAVYAAMEWLEPSPSLVLSATQDRTLQPLIDLLESLFEIYSPQGQWETARLVAGGV